MCKHRNVFSLLVLIGREAWPQNNSHNPISGFWISLSNVEKILAMNFFGGYSEEVTPVPIPNTEVKLFSADGTAWAAMWESRTPPENL